VFDLGYTPAHERDYHASTLYGQSKARGEELVREARDLRGWTILRPSGIWGPWFAAPYRHLFATIRRGVYVHPGHRAVRKSYGYVENSVDQMIRLATAPPAKVEQRTFWIADPAIDVREWTGLIQTALHAPRIRTAPVGLLRIAARLGDVAKRASLPAPMTSFRLNNMVTDMLFDTTELEAVVGPPPFSPERGVARTVEWLRSGRVAPD
jgi:nucleoside-diphosphate-sugar epimerase